MSYMTPAERFGLIWRRPFQGEQNHLDVLTGIRGWAALWVFLYHAWGYAGHPLLILALGPVAVELTPLVSIGFAGVTIFFVLSGFLLSLPFAEWQAGRRPRPETGRYFLRRVLRVFPAYYAQLLVLLVIGSLVPGQPGIDAWAAFVRHLFMLFTPPPLGMAPMNGVWWTLPIEFSFYLALPILAFTLRPGRAWLLFLGSLLAMYLWRHGVVLTLAESPVPQRVVAAYQLPGSMDAFGIGMLTALLYVHRGSWPAWLFSLRRIASLGALGMLLILSAVYWLPIKRHEYWADNPIFYLWTPSLVLGVAAIVLSGALGGKLVTRLFGNRFMVYLGLISYSLYLWHYPILTWIVGAEWVTWSGAMRFLGLTLATTPLMLLAATLSYLIVELPGMRFGRGVGVAR